jgi:hypothetical protein
MMRATAVLLTMLAATVLACGASSPEPKGPNAFARQAAFDLNCPVDQLGYVPIKTSIPRTYGVVGCHKRVTYVEICSIAMYGFLRDESCQWTMSGPIQVQVAAPRPAPPIAPATSAASASEATPAAPAPPASSASSSAP